jgi:hypothetical protein
VDELLDRIRGPIAFLHVADGSLAASLAQLDADTVRAALGRRLLTAVAAAWERGWQPTDLCRYVDRRRLPGIDADLLRTCLGEEARPRVELGRRVAPAWMAQLDALGIEPTPSGAVERWLGGQGGDAGLTAGVVLLSVLVDLHDEPRLADPPSTWTDGRAASDHDVPAALLARIRALLAKAESTEFDAEAEAFTEKAQELMARHRIDRALLADSEPTERLADGVVGRRVSIDDPYATAKFHLLAGIARANGARTIWSKATGMATVFGFPVEVDIVEELFTSLLVQATSALYREGSKVDAYGRSRTKAFRRSFLLAFGSRVAERLRHTVDRVVVEATTETGTDLVPLFAERREAVAARVDELYPDLGTMSASCTDAEGAFAGRLAGDRADLSAGPSLRRSA